MKTETAKFKVKNEKIKRAYFQYIQGGKGFSPATVEIIEEAIWKWEEFSQEADFGRFRADAAKDFKKWLGAERNGRELSLSSQYHVLRHLRNFFTWLSGQNGYKSRIKPYDIQYLSLDQQQSRIANSPKRKDYPSLDYVLALCRSIEQKTEVDQRDRALIAFALLSGARDSALATLPLGCFDVEKLVADQDPEKGVQTKFRKHIITTLMRFHEDLVGHVLEWAKYLRENRLFGNADPLFPKTKLQQKAENDSCFDGTEVEAAFWKSAGPIRNIFRQRMVRAGMKYHHPHSFRHAAVYEASKHARTPEEMRAISQNFGHSNMGTT
jgi:integrase